MKAATTFSHEIIIDAFAGGGGASSGIEAALGRPVDIAINHSEHAIGMHRINHPSTMHLQTSVWDISKEDLQGLVGQRKVALLWASPDCRHFSVAKGGQPNRDDAVRSLAWVVVRYASAVKPRCILLENVPEFADWGPLDGGKVIKETKGETFKLWLQNLRDLGYQVEHKVLQACDFGAPTKRKRLFVIARLDGPPVWPAPSHGPGTQRAWKTAAECIDWSLQTNSIFLTRAQCRAGKIRARRPLQPSSLLRIAKGIRRYVIENPRPFIIRTGHASSKAGTGMTLRGQEIDQPLSTVTTLCDFAVVDGVLVPRNPEKGAQTLSAAYIAQHNGGVVGHQAVGKPADVPMSTVSQRGSQQQPVVAFLTKFYGTGVGQDAGAPLGSVTTRDRFQITEVQLDQELSARVDAVKELLRPEFPGIPWEELGTVVLDGEVYQIADISIRMLTPRELYNAQGFGRSYVIDEAEDENGKRYQLTKKDSLRLCGNAVPPPWSAALTWANVALPATRRMTA